MRVINSLKNSIVSVFMSIITIVIGFITQAIFIKTLGNEYLGINGLFTNIVSMLGIVELGFGNAILYNLYRPIAMNEIEKIKSILKFYKKAYFMIAILFFCIGLCILPFLNLIVGQTNIKDNIYIIFILFLVDVIISYLLTYKRSVLYANQKNYISNLIHIGYLILTNITQIIFLLMTQNFMFFLIIKILCRVIENLVIISICNRFYPYIKEKNIETLGYREKNDIVKKVKALFFHKIGGFLVLGTDNIIISMTPNLGIVAVGLYSNYNLILAAVSNLFSQIFTSLTASVGNLLVEDNKSKSYSIYNKMLLLNSWLFSFASVCIFCMIEPFIELWIGKEYILSKSVLIVLVINFYIQGMRKTCNTFKEAAGIFHEDRFVPLLESFLNIIASLILVNFYGLAGVFMGTVISSTALFFYSYPKYVYKPLFNKSYFQYAKENIFYCTLTLVSILLTVFITGIFNLDNILLKLIINGISCLIIPNLIYFIILYKTSDFKYYLNIITKILNKSKNKLEKTI